MRRPKCSSIEDAIDKKPNGCWLWLGSKDTHGYGTACLNGKHILIHRYMYEKYVGPIPEGFILHHECKEKSCVNYNHVTPLPKIEHLKLHNPKTKTKEESYKRLTTRIAERKKALRGAL